MQNLVHIHFRLLDKHTNPITGDSIKVKLFDEDIIQDDHLGSSKLDEDGRGEIIITRDKFSSWDSPGEKYPDLYFELYNGANLQFKSKVFKDLKIEESDDQRDDGIHYDLGTFVI